MAMARDKMLYFWRRYLEGSSVDHTFNKWNGRWPGDTSKKEISDFLADMLLRMKGGKKDSVAMEDILQGIPALVMAKKKAPKKARQ